MKNTKALGDVTVGCVMASLLKLDYVVLLPFGDNQRYDLVIDQNGKFSRVQCKTGKLTENKGIIIFNTASYSNGMASYKTFKDYRGQADLFGVFCPQNNKTYLIPVSDVPSGKGYLRVEEPKNKIQKGIRWAKKYEI